MYFPLHLDNVEKNFSEKDKLVLSLPTGCMDPLEFANETIAVWKIRSPIH